VPRKFTPFECNQHPENSDEWSPQGRCRICNREYQRTWFAKNRSVQAARVKVTTDRVRAENKDRLWAYLITHPCVDCGIADPRVLEADHVQGNQRAAISRLIYLGANWEAIAAELDKCEVRCANCHRIKTSERGGHWRHLRYHAAVSPHAYDVTKG
jgi:hypothetical protein